MSYNLNKKQLKNNIKDLNLIFKSKKKNNKVSFIILKNLSTMKMLLKEFLKKNSFNNIFTFCYDKYHYNLIINNLNLLLLEYNTSLINKLFSGNIVFKAIYYNSVFYTKKQFSDLLNYYLLFNNIITSNINIFFIFKYLLLLKYKIFYHLLINVNIKSIN
jgi:hypothetical protein